MEPERLTDVDLDCSIESSGGPLEISPVWSGHGPNHVSERYTKLREERDFRLEWTERIGLGFELPPSIGQLGNFASLRKWPK